MRSTARQTHDNRTITVDCHNEATYCQLLDDGKAFVALVLAFLLSLGFQLTHTSTGRGGEAQSLSHREGVSPPHGLWPGALAFGLFRARKCRSVYPVVSGIATCGVPAGAVVSGPGHPDGWLRQHDQEHAHAWATVCAM